jgi:hypothetical protein
MCIEFLSENMKVRFGRRWDKTDFRETVCQSVDWIIPLKSKLIQIIFKNSARTAKKTQHFTITKISWLTPFKGITADYKWQSFETHRYKMKNYYYW